MCGQVPNESEEGGIRCHLREQALTKMFQSVRDLADQFNEDCLSERYGLDIDMDSYEMRKLYEEMGYGFMWPQLSVPHEGIFDDIETNADTYLDSVCDFTDEWEESKTCIETPVTESFLTFESVETFQKEIKSCCKGVKDPMSQSMRDGLKKCLREKYLYEQFYPLGGLFMRSLMRIQFGKMLECESRQMTESGLQPTFRDIDEDEKVKYYTYYGYPKYLEEKMLMTQTMTPENYHFFLRGFVNETADPNNDFLHAACEACVMGEQLASQAYVYPGLMCPALVANSLYRPLQFEEQCPDKTFYKFQVANYCCLYAALDKYNLGKEYNWETCPDLSNVSLKSV